LIVENFYRSSGRLNRGYRLTERGGRIKEKSGSGIALF
jgi:hypothetical protein